MADENQIAEDCCQYPDIDICDVVAKLPRQYQQSPNIKNILNSYVESMNCVRQAMSVICGNQTCSDFEGEGLTAYGSSIGFPRCQCNIRCGFEGEQCIEDDEFYCRLIEAFLIQKRGPTVQNLCDAIKCLFGEDAFIINATNGVTQIATGRPLTDTEREFIKVIRSVIPHSCATRVEVYEIDDFSSVFGVSCGDGCTSYGDLCESEFLCSPVICEDEAGSEVMNQRPVTSGCEDEEFVFNSNVSIDTSIYFSDPDGGELTFYFFGLPSWLSSNSSGFLSGLANESGSWAITVIAEDNQGEQVQCEFTIIVSDESAITQFNSVLGNGESIFNGSSTTVGIGSTPNNQNILGDWSGSTCGLNFSSFNYNSGSGLLYIFHSGILPTTVSQFTVSQQIGSNSTVIDVSSNQGQSSYFVLIPVSQRANLQSLLSGNFKINGDC